DRAGEGALHEHEASVHGGAPVGRAEPRPDDEAQADPARGRRAEPDQPALWVPLPHALRAPGAVVLAERTGAQGGLAGALGRLPGAHGRRDQVAARPLPNARVGVTTVRARASPAQSMIWGRQARAGLRPAAPSAGGRSPPPRKLIPEVR